MGEIADDLIAGRTCSWCGKVFTREHTYPVVCKWCWNEATASERKDLQRAIYPEL